MARDDKQHSGTLNTLPRDLILDPQVRLIGEITEDWLKDMVDQLGRVDSDAPLIGIEVTTLGGDAEMARRAVLEIDLARERCPRSRLVFLGKCAVYSAGTTLMSAFPREDRFLTPEAMLLIHCRQLDKTIELQGPMRGSLPKVEALCHQIRTGIGIEMEHFERLIAGSNVTMDELLEKALYNWYLPARLALERELVAAIV